ncbi:MAG: SpoIID/LytB domain-containing protein [Gemmatimonadetes bacterium]|nr:SpoIID/LytB domain-containing protein [Gemmatimonadota bacterium]
MRRALPLALVLAAACGHREPPEVPLPQPQPPAAAPRPAARPAQPPAQAQGPIGAPFSGGPEIKIGLLVGVPRATVGGGEALAIRSADGGSTLIVPAGRTAELSLAGGRIQVEVDGRPRQLGAPLTVGPAEGGHFVRVGGRDHRGLIEVRRDDDGLIVIARLSFETYLGGVVAAELGVQDADVLEALKAQAVIARTYAVKNLGRNRRQGFDLLATVSDQRYDGVSGETPAAWKALADTKGEVVTWQGAPIDAFFHSTCGGRTASGAEVFTYADRPYLRSVSDLDPSGQAWCKSSPRFQWEQKWDARALTAALQRGGLHLTAEDAAGVRSIEATDRGPSGRVTRLRVRLRGRDVVIDGSNAVRRALPPPDLDLLRSAAFTLTTRNDGERIGELTLEGTGSGHGVGLCQWGAIGRARAGGTFTAILAAYYPGTQLEHRW